MTENESLMERRRPWGAVLAATAMMLLVCGVMYQNSLSNEDKTGLYDFMTAADNSREPVAIAIGQDGSVQDVEGNGELQRLLTLVEGGRVHNVPRGQRVLKTSKSGSGSSNEDDDAADDDAADDDAAEEDNEDNNDDVS